MRKLLIIGAGYFEIEIVRAAKEMGYYTIVTDNRINWDNAPAKKKADEAWNISYSDIELLAEKCRENRVEGCIAGYSEFRVKCAKTLCDKLGFPFYIGNVNFVSINNKILFKEKCVQSGVSVPKLYKKDEIEYPVIIKPADGDGSRGISICYNFEQAKEGYELALTFSAAKKVLIEQYIKADEVMIYFTVHNGIIDLSAMCDRYMYRFDDRITQLPVGYYFPSKHLDVFIKSNIQEFEKLIRSFEIENGLVAFQSFFIGNEAIPFDPTYRLDGSMSYHFCDIINNSNVLKMLINYSMNGTMGNDEIISAHENPFFTIPSFELPVLLGKGIISSVNGIEKIKQMPEVIYVFVKQKVGDEMKKTADFTQILCRIHLQSSNNKTLCECIGRIFDHLSVLDEKGNDMIINRGCYESIIQTIY